MEQSAKNWKKSLSTYQHLCDNVDICPALVWQNVIVALGPHFITFV